MKNQVLEQHERHPRKESADYIERAPEFAIIFHRTTKFSGTAQRGAARSTDPKSASLYSQGLQYRYNLGVPFMNSCCKFAAVIGCVLFPALLISRTSSADEPSAPERGVWQKHEYSFVFMGFTSTYSCDGLADKIKLLLLAAGARPDAKSAPGACANGYGVPDKFARANLTFYTLAPSGSDTPSGSKPVNGIWRPVSISDYSPRDLRTGDCELVEQFRHDVLPMFTARNIEDHTTCIPHQESGSNISLRFESFAAAPATPHAPPRRT
jgi:hypothetical protein